MSTVIALYFPYLKQLRNSTSVELSGRAISLILHLLLSRHQGLTPDTYRICLRLVWNSLCKGLCEYVEPLVRFELTTY